MISLEQVRLLESKVAKTIDYVKKLSEEKAALKGKLDSCQKRIRELEVLVNRFREDQSRIEEGILSALDRLNQFEDALETKAPAEAKIPAEIKVPAETKAPAESAQPRENPPDPEAKTGRKKNETAMKPETRIEEESSGPADGELDIF